MNCYLGVDLGTSSVKTAVFDTEGVCLGSSKVPLGKLSGFSTDRHLHDPRQWWKKTVQAVRETLASVLHGNKLCGIACCGFHHIPVFLDSKGQPAMPVLMMHDVELPRFRKKLQEDGRLKTFHQATHSLVSSAHLPVVTEAVRILFSQEWKSVRHVMLSKDYLRYRLTGNIGTEFCDATGTHLVAFGECSWSAELAKCVGIDTDWLPSIAESADMAGELLPEVACELGVLPGIPVFYGGGDSHCALLGLGCIQNSSSAILLGTNCTLRMVFDNPAYDPQIRLWHQHHVLPDRWTVSASSLAGGSVVAWGREVFQSGDVTDAKEPVSPALACSKGLYFLPFIHGERCPFHAPEATGAFVGIRSHHSAQDFLQAIREGNSFALKMCWETVCSLKQLNGQLIATPVLSGGGSQDRGWGQLIADVLGQDLHLASGVFAGCRGAAMLAGIGTGAFATYEDAVQQAESCTEQVAVSSERSKQLEPHYHRFQHLVEQLV